MRFHHLFVSVFFVSRCRGFVFGGVFPFPKPTGGGVYGAFCGGLWAFSSKDSKRHGDKMRPLWAVWRLPAVSVCGGFMCVYRGKNFFSFFLFFFVLGVDKVQKVCYIVDTPAAQNPIQTPPHRNTADGANPTGGRQPQTNRAL